MTADVQFRRANTEPASDYKNQSLVKPRAKEPLRATASEPLGKRKSRRREIKQLSLQTLNHRPKMASVFKDRANDQHKEADLFFKFLLLGNSGTGKSSFQCRFVEGTFPSTIKTTIGFEFKFKTVQHQPTGKTVKLQVFDTAGSERYQAVTTNYYRGADAILLFYNVDSRKSFATLPRWFQRIADYAPEGTPVVLVGNKADVDEKLRVGHHPTRPRGLSPDSEIRLRARAGAVDYESEPGTRAVPTKDAENFARLRNVPFYETSAKNGENVNEALLHAVGELIEQRHSLTFAELSKIIKKSRIKTVGNRHIKIPGKVANIIISYLYVRFSQESTKPIIFRDDSQLADLVDLEASEAKSCGPCSVT